MNRLVLVDVGSTTTKAILLENEGGWRYRRHEAPTTVEAPHSDVTVGMFAALRGLEAETGVTIVADGRPALPLFVTSSAGGGLAMVVTGLVGAVTARSAERAAMGAGALILDTIALDDGRVPYRKVEALRRLRPDMLLFAGGFDGEAISGPVLLAELVRESRLTPRLDPAARLPVLFAGNVGARAFVEDTLGDRFLFQTAPNLRPGSDVENLEPTRTAIHETFMEHVMSHAPGYAALTEWVEAPILPTPFAVTLLLETLSRRQPGRLLAIDIGGATTDVFTAEDGKVTRTVSPNLGMSYSALNVARISGAWLPRVLGGWDEDDLVNRIGEKHVRPTRLPGTRDDVRVERALAAAAVREAVREHLAVLEGTPLSRDTEDLSLRSTGRRKRGRAADPEFSLEGYRAVIGSGGILSHSPREASAHILVRALQPVGVVNLAVDRAFLFPHLGVLAESDPELAVEIATAIGIVPLGTVVAPRKRSKVRVAAGAAECRARSGETAVLPLETSPGESLTVKARGIASVPVAEGTVGGRLGVLVDARGRRDVDPAVTFFPESFDPPPERVGVAAETGLDEGRLRVRREIAVTGDVLVAVGDEVATDTTVARSTKTFPRPFFLNVAADLGVPAEEVGGLLKVKEGEEVEVKQVVARHTGALGAVTEVGAPITGTVERILADGRVVFRESEEVPSEVRAVEVARDLGLRRAEALRHVVVELGQEVSEGQPVARKLTSRGYWLSKSPIRGTVHRIDSEFGIVLVAPLIEKLEIAAGLPGRVVEVTRRGAVIEGEGIRLRGLWGTGGEAAAPLSVGEPRSGHLFVAGESPTESLEALAEAGVRGLVVGGTDLRGLLDEALPFPVFVVEGFGPRDLPETIVDRLRPYDGRPALLDSTTELRAGVRRPFLAVFS
ncbi:MAG: glutamate mutase L [Planctomycetota bacterium]